MVRWQGNIRCQFGRGVKCLRRNGGASRRHMTHMFTVLGRIFPRLPERIFIAIDSRAERVGSQAVVRSACSRWFRRQCHPHYVSHSRHHEREGKITHEYERWWSVSRQCCCRQGHNLCVALRTHDNKFSTSKTRASASWSSF